MPTDHILALLIEERDKLNRANRSSRRDGHQTPGPSKEESCGGNGDGSSGSDETPHEKPCGSQGTGAANEGLIGRSGERP